MFKNWGFLVGEIWFLILLAALLGLFAGWLIWGGRRKAGAGSDDTAVAVASSAPAAAADPGPDFDRDGVKEGRDEGVKPATLTAPRGGKADNLKKIKGVGPKLEQLCNRLGFWHFDQIAAWSDEEVAWVDANLEGFKGRVTRDDWVEQAKLLAEGGTTEFSKRVEAGGVYDKDK